MKNKLINNTRCLINFLVFFIYLHDLLTILTGQGLMMLPALII